MDLVVRFLGFDSFPLLFCRVCWLLRLIIFGGGLLEVAVCMPLRKWLGVGRGSHPGGGKPSGGRYFFWYWLRSLVGGVFRVVFIFLSFGARWVFLEVRVLRVVFLFYEEILGAKRLRVMKNYLVVQGLASTSLVVFMWFGKEREVGYFFLLMGLFLKLGICPSHLWASCLANARMVKKRRDLFVWVLLLQKVAPVGWLVVLVERGSTGVFVVGLFGVISGVYGELHFEVEENAFLV